jgi:uncharacterized protein YjiS (DUF1127 family)
MTLREIERDLARTLRSWRSSRDFDRCDPRRRELLEQAASAPITSVNDAAAAVRIFLLAATDGDGLQSTGPQENRHLANIIRAVRRWLAAMAATA